ncbi:helix-turn-helix domain-containing protein [Lentzea sp. NPDC054927]
MQFLPHVTGGSVLARKESPVVVKQRQLLGVLKQARESLDLTQQSVADALDWSVSKVLRIEQGKTRVSVTDLKALLLHYRITESDQVNELVELARATKRPGWMSAYKGLPEQFAQFVEFESVAICCRYVQMSIIPGMLQARSYATAMMERGGTDTAIVRRGVDIRMHRQELLGPDGPEMFFIIDESALHRVIGSVEVMREQLSHLRNMALAGDVSIQIVPFSAGLHPAMKGSFSILDLTEEEGDSALFLEELHQDTLFQNNPEEVRQYLDRFAQLEKFALPASETPRFVKERLKRMGGETP